MTLEEFRKEKDTREIAELQDNGNKRLALVTIILALIPVPLIAFIPQNYLQLFTIGWFIWVIIGILLSVKIINKIWK